MTTLALDAGNSSVKAAVWDGAAWEPVVRLPPDPDAWPAALDALAPDGVDRAGIASVVPAHTDRLADAVRQQLGVEAVVVSARLPLPFAMAYATPATLGPDRLAAAVAAWAARDGARPVVALDAGTAVTVDVVDVRENGPVYLGGAIAPGPALLLRALGRGTGALPDVDWTDASPPIGRSTREAIQSGVAGLFAGGVERLLAQTAGALGRAPVVVATGGWAPWLAEHVGGIDAVAPMLVLDGVRRLTDAARS